MATFVTHSPEETKALARQVTQKKTSGIIALSGELGAGKTTFTQGLAEGLGIKEPIISPTFILIRQYQTPKSGRIFYHVDLYRLEEDLGSIGLGEIIGNKENLVVIEWAEKAKSLLPEDVVKINLDKLEGNLRRITVSGLQS